MNFSDLKRKKLLINPRFQLTCIGYMTLISGIAMIVFYSASSYFFWRFQKMGTDLGIPSHSVFFQFISKQQNLMNEIAAMTAVVLFILIVFVGIIFSHRISGPIHRLETHLRRLAEGKGHEHLRFRKSDYFPELAQAFNLAIDSITQKHPSKKKP